MAEGDAKGSVQESDPLWMLVIYNSITVSTVCTFHHCHLLAVLLQIFSQEHLEDVDNLGTPTHADNLTVYLTMFLPIHFVFIFLNNGFWVTDHQWRSSLSLVNKRDVP